MQLGRLVGEERYRKLTAPLGDRLEVDSKLLEILVCPVSKASLTYRRDRQELWCKVSRLAYPVRDDIPVMLEAEARTLTREELDEM